ncbi:MAG: type II toxin-antitoxin system VapB family antitoxin [Calditrichia bacterium]
MATNLDLDDRLINEAKRLGNHKTKKSAVTQALQEYIKRHKQLEVLELFGKIDHDPEYDFRDARNQR